MDAAEGFEQNRISSESELDTDSLKLPVDSEPEPKSNSHASTAEANAPQGDAGSFPDTVKSTAHRDLNPTDAALPEGMSGNGASSVEDSLGFDTQVRRLFSLSSAASFEDEASSSDSSGDEPEDPFPPKTPPRATGRGFPVIRARLIIGALTVLAIASVIAVYFFDQKVDLVLPTNRAPIAANDTVSTRFGEAVMIEVMANDRDSDADAIKIVSIGQSSHGNVEAVGAGLRYTPEHGFSGEDYFEYTIADEDGATAGAKVTVLVFPPPLQSASDYADTRAGEQVRIAVLANDKGQGPLSIVDVRAEGLDVRIDGDDLIVAPPKDSYGTVQLSYSVRDRFGQSVEEKVSLRIAPVVEATPPPPDPLQCGYEEFAARLAAAPSADRLEMAERFQRECGPVMAMLAAKTFDPTPRMREVFGNFAVPADDALAVRLYRAVLALYPEERDEAETRLKELRDYRRMQRQSSGSGTMED